MAWSPRGPGCCCALIGTNGRPGLRESARRWPAFSRSRTRRGEKGARRSRLWDRNDRDGCGSGGASQPALSGASLYARSGSLGLQCLANLDRLPPTGALISAAPLKIHQGSGQPASSTGTCGGPSHKCAVAAIILREDSRPDPRSRNGNRGPQDR